MMSVGTLYDWLCRILGIAFVLFMVYVLLAGLRHPADAGASGMPAERAGQHVERARSGQRWVRRDDGVVVLLTGEADPGALSPRGQPKPRHNGAGATEPAPLATLTTLAGRQNGSQSR